VTGTGITTEILIDLHQAGLALDLAKLESYSLRY
jgi:hypothetical protein